MRRAYPRQPATSQREAARFFYVIIITMKGYATGGAHGHIWLKAAAVAIVCGITPFMAYAASPSFTRNLAVGSLDTAIVKDVSALQRILIAEKFLEPPATGYFGKKTKAALVAWQAAHGIVPATGFFGSRSQSIARTERLAPTMPAMPSSTPSVPAAHEDATSTPVASIMPLEPVAPPLPKSSLVVSPTLGFSLRGDMSPDSARHTIVSYALTNGGAEVIAVTGFTIVTGVLNKAQSPNFSDLQALIGDRILTTVPRVDMSMNVPFKTDSKTIILNPGETKQVSLSAIVGREAPTGVTASFAIRDMKTVGIQSGKAAAVSGDFPPSELTVVNAGGKMGVTLSSGGAIEARGQVSTVMNFRVKNYSDKTVSVDDLVMRWSSAEEGLMKNISVVSNGVELGRYASDIRLPSSGTSVEISLKGLGESPLIPGYGFRDFSIQAYAENSSSKTRSIRIDLERVMYGSPYPRSNSSGLPIGAYLP